MASKILKNLMLLQGFRRMRLVYITKECKTQINIKDKEKRPA
jgi:hypothetical protein